MEQLKKITTEEISPTLHAGREDSPELGTEGMQELFDAHPNLNTNRQNENTDIQNRNNTLFDEHMSSAQNPHEVTKTQVGLGNVDNTSDMEKPVSTAQGEVLGQKADKMNTYTKSEVDVGLASKADRIDTYTKIEVDTRDLQTLEGAKAYTDKKVVDIGAGDMAQAVYDPQRKGVDVYGYVDNSVGEHAGINDIHTSLEEKEAVAEHISNTETHVTTLIHTKTGTIHTLTGIPTVDGIYTSQFKATADYLQGDTFDGYTAKPVGEDISLADRAFVTGDLVTVVVDTQSKKLGFKVGGGGINDTLPSQITGFTATAGNTQVILSWTNPTSSFTGLLIMRKAGSMPTGVKDGVKVYDGIGTGHIDTTVTNDTIYYYRAFPYNAKKQYQTEIDGGVVSAKPVAEPTDYAEIQRYTSNGTWIAPEDNWYRIHTIGASGKGGDIPVTQTANLYHSSAGGGGGAGGVAIKELYIKAGTTFNITVNSTLSSIGSECSATAGTNGGNGVYGRYDTFINGGTGGIGGIASGGNILNQNGGGGGAGGRANPNNNVNDIINYYNNKEACDKCKGINGTASNTNSIVGNAGIWEFVFSEDSNGWCGAPSGGGHGAIAYSKYTQSFQLSSSGGRGGKFNTMYSGENGINGGGGGANVTTSNPNPAKARYGGSPINLGFIIIEKGVYA